MSNASRHSRGMSAVDNLRQESRLRREGSYSRRKPVTSEDAYYYALRAAYLYHLLQPRAKRIKHVTNPKPVQKTTGAMDLVQSFTGLRDSSKSTKLPRGFMNALEKRITSIMYGKEKLPEFHDPAIVRTLASFLNEFKNPAFRKNVEEDRRVEDLILKVYTCAVKELQKGKTPDDDGWKLMVDRHVALFLRLLSAILKANDWDRPELAARLQMMEKKMLIHDQDLTARSTLNGGAGGHSVEVEVPMSTEVKDMPLVLVVSRVFSIPYGKVQEDINQNKATWDEKAALRDLKTYQTCISMNAKQTLSSEDFDTEEAYEAWKKAEIPEVAQMILSMVQTHRSLASNSKEIPVAQFRNQTSHDPGYSDISRKMSNQTDSSGYAFDQPVDMSALSLNDSGPVDNVSFTFIPPEPRAYFRAVLKEVLMYDILNQDPPAEGAEASATGLFSKQSTELLNELALRWRLPQSSKLILFLDVVKELFQHRQIDLEALDAAFLYFKETHHDKKANRRSMILHDTLSDWRKWSLADYAMYQNVLNAVHECLQRDLYEAMQACYDTKWPAIGSLMYVLENHVYGDELFAKGPEDLDEFSNKLEESLKVKAAETYRDLLKKTIPETAEEWEFYHVIQLGKAVVKLCDRIQKRFKKTPAVMGVNPLMILVGEVLPSYAGDARELVERIMAVTKQKGEEIPLQDGFDLYKELVEIRQVHADVLPDIPFAFKIEQHLQEFVWRWISMTESSITGWVEGAVKQDNFEITPNNDDQRHSVSVVDIFRSFNECIEQVAQLNWDDDLQYAKFMTAMAKAVGLGIAKYCDLVEQIFAKEMDRLTPEQEAERQQSRQERWMQLAKDAWANKERVEPFQFLPESLIKLNNIEYATLQLDKLEAEMNVDACAEVIQKNAPPLQQRQRRVENYVFTIKIIEGEDLKPCDINGLSDPYVVLGDEYQKRLAKTRVIYRNLNPRWDESVDITTTGPLNIIATIWDWDAMGDHDCVGRTSLKLDPSHFRDFLPREYWLDLDTQGRLLLRVSMEGERDDIQFYFGKAFRTLKRTERDMTRKVTDKLSAYISHSLSRQRLRSMLSKGISIQSVTSAISYFQRNRVSTLLPTSTAPTQLDITNALKPLFNYFDDNFAIMKQTLTDSAMIMVMSRLWKEVLSTIESLLVPPLSDKPSMQQPLTQQELDIVFKWLELLFDFFHAVDEETGTPHGVPIDILKNSKYHELQNLNFFYFEPTEDLIRTSESMAAAAAARASDAQIRQPNRLSAPPAMQSPAFGGAAGLLGTPTRRSKSIMLSRNLGTMRKAKEEKRKAAQAEPNDDIILRILRMRPEAERYLRDRSRQKERLAATAAAAMIVRQSMNKGGGGRMVGVLPSR
ncbi:hypothetical protein EJ06DRAFT_555612 [Trichodelitschia bisporula]|uniref:C2 domain protein n=1 Tax=Trichodelitschia bisporula TaxID=703511 RepID=A0A6G1I181_9PEZI|nr:hypothetical protein EJ06DRAFT_555612 [Trichodelitschia bisporula]